MNYNYSDVTFGVSITGDGRSDYLTLRPITPQSFVAWSPPGALNTTSAMSRRDKLCAPGFNLIVSAAQLISVASLGYTAVYVAIQPRSNYNTVSWTLAGSTLDVGIGMQPGYPAIVALPNPMPANWNVFVNASANVVMDIYLW